jgi:hypothetical protein
VALERVADREELAGVLQPLLTDLQAGLCVRMWGSHNATNQAWKAIVAEQGQDFVLNDVVEADECLRDFFIFASSHPQQIAWIYYDAVCEEDHSYAELIVYNSLLTEDDLMFLKLKFGDLKFDFPPQ